MTSHPAARRGQRGLSIVELMIALAIGLFMMAGFVGSFLSMKRAFTAQDRLSELQDNERLALTLLTSAVRAAGYQPDPIGSTPEQALPASTSAWGSLASGQGLVGTSGHAAPGESLTTRYVMPPGGALTNCLGQGNTGTAAVLVLNTYTIGPRHELMCSLDGGATQTALVGGVQSMSVLYGADTTNSGGVDRYLSAADVAAAGWWQQVHSVRLTLRFVNPYAAEPGEPATIDWVQTINLMNRT